MDNDDEKAKELVKEINELIDSMEIFHPEVQRGLLSGIYFGLADTLKKLALMGMKENYISSLDTINLLKDCMVSKLTEFIRKIEKDRDEQIKKSH